jgi:hypothetical protein
MTTPLYSPQGQEQYLDIRFVFKVKHSPGDKYHLSVLLKEYLRQKGIPLEDESHRIEI